MPRDSNWTWFSILPTIRSLIKRLEFDAEQKNARRFGQSRFVLEFNCSNKFMEQEQQQQSNRRTKEPRHAFCNNEQDGVAVLEREWGHDAFALHSRLAVHRRSGDYVCWVVEWSA